ncbi:glycosyltransferase family 2 protein [bacterium]|nr:glycosyltransferase family 2 protein [bacterium]
MDLSICIVSYQCKDKLRECLESLRAHRPTVEHEVIVVDNGSTDGTPEMLRSELYWARSILNPDNRGFSVACNQGFEASSGKTLMMLNPDTLLTHDAFDGLLRFVRERPWIGAVGPKLLQPDAQPEMSCREFPTLMNALWNLTGLSTAFSGSKVFGHLEMSWWDHAEPRAVDWLSGAAVMFTRTAWEKVGPLDEGFFLQGAELDWQKRLARQGFERWYLPTATILHHPGRSWTSKEADEVVPVHRAAFRYFRKHHGPLSSFVLRAMATIAALPKAVWYGLASVLWSRKEQTARRASTEWLLLRTALGVAPRGH